MSMTEVSPDIQRFLSPEERTSIRAPIGEARTFPSLAFTSQDFLDFEGDTVFRNNWVAVCFDQQMPNAGDAAPLEILGLPLLAVRGDDGQIRVFHNVCPYDGCPVAMEPLNGISEFEVTYHGWRYDLRGKLRAIPYWDGTEGGDLAALGNKDCDLVEVPSGVRLGVVFVNIGNNAPSLDEHLEPLKRLMSEQWLHDFDALVAVEDDDGDMIRKGRTLATNWKTYMENSVINILHEGFTHEFYRRSPYVPRVKDGVKTHEVHLDRSLMAMTFTEDSVGDTYSTITPPAGAASTAAPRSALVTLYPNLVIIAPFSETVRTNICLPQSPGLTRLLHCMWFGKEKVAAPDFDSRHANLVKAFHIGYKEDGDVAEAIQRSRKSPLSGGHFYAPFWDEQHHHFNKLILADLETSRS